MDEQIRGIVSQNDRIISVNELITMQMGPQHILVNLSLGFDSKLSSGDVQSTITDFNEQIKEAIPTVSRVFIEAESWAEHHAQRSAQHGDEAEHPSGD